MKIKKNYHAKSKIDLNDKIFLVNKPKFFSSNETIQILKKAFNIKKIGHGGTLDPLANGLLLVATNSKTKELTKLILENKEYLAEIQFNYQTSTFDSEGQIINFTNLKINEWMLEKTLKFFNNVFLYQKPPIFSAIKIKGKKLYDYAIKNKKVEIPFRKVQIYKTTLISFDFEKQIAKILLKVSKGFYVRSFANDIGIILNNFAYLKNLTRTKIGNYKLKNAYDFHDLVTL
ncbi:MAG: tRNA pseudouridine(55) synthase TruB [Malacoplasma sp.]|nr:tRNA pseudouridine(55) synthase TruB [Malacoplasma sp.]